MAARYGQFLRELLRPLGVYDLSSGTVNESELYAAGSMLDQADTALETAEQESLIATAEGEGLSRREELFARKPAADTVPLRRAALLALFQIDGDCFTLETINRTICGCGIRAEAQETDTQGKLRVVFPDVAGIPPQFDRMEKIILDIIPCHLETEFYFRYLTWAECEARATTLRDILTVEDTWESFLKSV